MKIDFTNKRWQLVARICSVVFVSLFSLMLITFIITSEVSGAISAYFGSRTFYKIQLDEDEEQDTMYFKSKYKNVSEVLDSGSVLAEKIMAEGAVLLKNDNNALPLKDGKRNVSVFGAACVNPAYGGTGSAAAARPVPPVALKEGLEGAGFTLNETLWSFYSDNVDTYKPVKDKINEAPWADVNAAASSSYATHGDSAIMVLRRIRGEAADVVISDTTKTDAEDGNFLKLSPNERGMLENLKAEKEKGTFKNIVVLLNCPNLMEGAFIDDPSLGIDAALWVGSVGASGFNAIGDILAGKVNPSGKLSDTYFKEHKYNPALANFGAAAYTNRDDFASQLPGDGGAGGGAYGSIVGMYYTRYAVYREGVYVGYRYTETRYEDYVMGTPNAGTYNYSDVVSYPFGHGESYTDFTYSDFKVEKDGKDYTVSVKVTNDGDMPGKEAVQIYLQKPYETYEKNNKVEKPSVELVAYDKTDIIAPKDSDVVTLTVKGRDFASYDANNAKTYYVADGMHYLTAAKDAHAAVNNILAKKGKTPANTENKMDEAGNASLVKELDRNFDDKTYSVTEKTNANKKIENRFDFVDINKYEHKGGNNVKYTSRNDWAGTLPVFASLAERNNAAEKLVMTQGMVDDMLAQDNVDSIKKEESVSYPKYEQENALVLADMRFDSEGKKIAYDDPVWEAFLDQLSWDEIADFVSTGFRKTGIIESITKPETKDHNGPTGLTQPFGENPDGLAAKTNDPKKDVSPTYYPAINILASTFSHDITVEYGDQLGEESIWAGYNGFYGIGMNIHRTAYDGRVFEYYSEDPFLTGSAATDVVINIQKHGCYAYIKHIALQEQQDCRMGVNLWLTEQTYREIYLRPFEMTMVDGDAHAAMVSFSRAGAKNSVASDALMNGFMRDECGFDGFTVSDAWGVGYKSEHLPVYLMNGLDIPDGDIAKDKAFNQFKPGNGYGNVAHAMRESAHRILYTVAHSNAMNGYTSGTRIVKIMPDWQVAVVTLLAVFGVFMLASIAFAISCFVFNEKKRLA